MISVNNFSVHEDLFNLNGGFFTGGAEGMIDLDKDGDNDDVETTLMLLNFGVSMPVTVRFMNLQNTPIIGSTDADFLLGTLFRDTINGNSGNDTISGLSADDSLSGSEGQDILLGEDGNDVLSGDAGNDELLGGDGDDTIRGGSGDDTLQGGLGNDAIFLGEGFDVISAQDGRFSGNDTIYGFDTGKDWIAFGGDISITESIDADGDGSKDDAILVSDTVILRFIDLSYNPRIIGTGTQPNGTSFSDTIRGSIDSEAIFGWSGNDSIYGDGGNDNIDGGFGADTVFGEFGSDVLAGQAGDDVVDGGDGNDRLTGNEGNDRVSGGGGNDLVAGGRGDDRLTGGDGSDLFFGDTQISFSPFGGGFSYTVSWSGHDTITDFDFYADRIFYSDLVTHSETSRDFDNDGQNDDARFIGWRFVSASERGVVRETFTVTLLNTTPAARDGTAAADEIIATPFHETISGLAGADTITGGSGNDWISGGDGDDRLSSGYGIDTLHGDIGNDFIEVFGWGVFATGGEGNDTLSASSQVSGVFAGGAGDDSIRLQNGDERVESGEGADTIVGSLGLDTIDGGSGIDQIRFTGSIGTSIIERVIVDISSGSASVLGNIWSPSSISTGSTRVVNVEIWSLTGGNDVLINWINGPVIYGGAGNDWMADYASASNSAGAGNNDWMFGEDGDDGLYGLEGDDNLYGGMGRDVLVGGTGADRLSGDLGSDWIALGLNAAGTAGDGAADVVLFASRWDSWDPGQAGMDAVLQFETGLDRLDLSAIDANTTLAGDQAFTLGALAAGQAGRLQITMPAGQSWTLVQADVDGDGAADLTVIVYGATGQAMLTAGDFVL